MAGLPGGGSRVTWIEWVEPPFGRAGQVGWLAVRPAVAASLRVALRRFAADVAADGQRGR